MKKLILIIVAIFSLNVAFGQTTYNWRDPEATSGSWNVANHWWNGSTAQLPMGNDILEFNNNNQVVMTNDLTTTNRHKITFGSSATQTRIIAGTTENTFYDFSDTWPWIKNSSGALHEINFPVKIGYPDFELIADTNVLKFGNTIDNNGHNVHIYGNNMGTNTNTRYIELSKSVTGTGKLIVSQFGIGKISAPDLPTVAYSGNTEINRGELWVETNDAIGTASPIYIGNGTNVSHKAKLFLSKLDGGINFTNNITINPGDNERRFLGGLNTSGLNIFSGNIALGSSELNVEEVLTAGELLFSGVISGNGAIKTVGNGTVLLSGTNTYTGLTNISGGILELAANDVIDNNSKLNINGGMFSTGAGFSDTLNTLILENTGTIQLATNSVLHFNNSSGETWVSGKVLFINGWNNGGRIFVDTDASGLDSVKLGQIKFEGFPQGAIMLPTGEVIPTILSAVGDIIITEIMVDPTSVSDANGEWFEIYNTTANDINIQGWVIADGGTTAHAHIIADSVVVPANGYALLAKNGDSASNGGLPTVTYDYDSLIFTNTDIVSISLGPLVIDSVSYDNGATFPKTAGKSMSLRANKFTSNLNDIGYSWCDATSVYGDGDFGTPGTANDDCKCNNLEEVTWESGAWSDESNAAITPTVEHNVLIKQSYNTNTDGGSIEACSCRVYSGNVILTIADGDYLKVENNIQADTTTGEIRVKNEGSIVQVNDDANVIGTNFKIEKTTNEYVEYDFTYWSSPIDNADIATVFAANVPSRIFDFNTANFLDTTPVNTYDDDGNDWNIASGTMTKGKGYIVMGSGSDWPFDPSNFATGLTQSVSFDGAINNGIITYPIVHDGGADNFENQNLIGNPYPSAIDATAFLAANTNLGGTLYFWSHDTQIAANGTTDPDDEAYNFTNLDYATWTTAGGVAAHAGNQVPSGKIASGQGFFVDLLDAAPNGVVTFNNAMRVTTGNDNFFKSENLNNDRVWINMTNENGIFRQILVGFFTDATNNEDRLYDGKRLFNLDDFDFYSLLNNQKYAIQGLAPLEDDYVLPLGFVAKQTGNITFSIDHFESLENTNIYIKDNLDDSLHDLKLADYTITISQIGEFNSRFELMFSRTALSIIENNNITKLIISQNENYFSLNTSNNTKINSATVYNLLGQELGYYQTNNSLLQIPNNNYHRGSILIIKVTLDNDATLTKKVIKQ